MKKNGVCTFAFSVLFAIILVGCGGRSSGGGGAQTESIVIRTAHIVTLEGAFHKAFLVMDEDLQKQSGGTMKLEIFPNAMLGGLTELIEAVQTGNLDMAVSASSFITNFVPDLAVFDLPFLFKDYAHVDKVLDGELGQNLLAKMEANNIKGLAWWEVGFRSVANSKFAIQTVDDIKGIRIRTMSNQIHQELFRELGADAVPMDWGDAFVGLQQGAIDACENAISVMYDNKTYEVCPYGSVTNHVYTPAGLLMSIKRWNSFTEQQKTWLMDSVKAGTKMAREENRRQELTAIDNLKKVGMNFVYPDVEPMRKKVLPVYDRHPELQEAVKQVRAEM